MLVQGPEVPQGKPTGSSLTLFPSGVQGSPRIRPHSATGPPSHCNRSVTAPNKTTRKERKGKARFSVGNRKTELRNRPGDSIQDSAMQRVVARLEEKEKEGAAPQQGLSQGCQTMLRGCSAYACTSHQAWKS